MFKFLTCLVVQYGLFNVHVLKQNSVLPTCKDRQRQFFTMLIHQSMILHVLLHRQNKVAGAMICTLAVDHVNLSVV